MTAFRSHLEFLRKTDDLRSLKRPETPSLQVIASEALRADCSAIRFESGDNSRLDFVSGAYGGVDQLSRGDRFPWSRLGIGLGIDRDPDYIDVLERIARFGDRIGDRDVTYVERAATATNRTVRELGFPVPPDETWPRITLGLLSAGGDSGSYWAPIHGTVIDDNTVRARVPEAIADRFARGDVVSIAIGVPSEALAATYLLTITDRLSTPIEDRDVGSTVPVIPTGGGVVPSSAELVFEAEVADHQPDTRAGKREFWEQLVNGTTVTLNVNSVFLREDPVVPFTPLDVPLTDDLQLVGLALAATLYDRANSYWGVAPVEWLLLPVASRLGICIVSTEMLYAGFEWQLSNFLFSFSDCYDTVVVVDDETGSRDLGQTLADIWVKAHPSRDWLFSETDAPVARLPTYGRAGTGARLYVDTTWDPRWEEEYIAPRVSFAESYPPDLRAAIHDSWAEFGFDTDPSSS